MMNYVIINQSFALAHQGYTRDDLRFNYSITLDGDYVCSANSLDEFPELFENSPYLFFLAVVSLSLSNFPAQTINV
jgi:hypothetical protein